MLLFLLRKFSDKKKKKNKSYIDKKRLRVEKKMKHKSRQASTDIRRNRRSCHRVHQYHHHVMSIVSIDLLNLSQDTLVAANCFRREDMKEKVPVSRGNSPLGWTKSLPINVETSENVFFTQEELETVTKEECA